MPIAVSQHSTIFSRILGTPCYRRLLRTKYKDICSIFHIIYFRCCLYQTCYQ